ncbi:metal-dependent phosphoesterase [Rathayibacter toxicus]|uniref:Metal-dependent phosphoesterase n=2 Tax=Rathayibacter toxicus TaxID=145458 RepID=A0A0C5BJ53_9MICO|nr:metal-dependent phosphoesterase [Rathayibacter toxicus]ALS56796.1 metal-dependent phosphoesterase [Rathayibacter toxicus]KKM46359.1 metal-dependent phosphoesterase [Rathayibacter toxicus]
MSFMHVEGGGYDLHTHSVVSDGTDAPSALIRAAASVGLDGVALTDHDSTGGWAEAAVAADEVGIDLLPGMEFSSRLGMASVHVLAYLVDPTDPALVAETARIRSERARRAEAIVTAIAVDYDLTWEDVLAQTIPGTTIGRPHIADALVARGLAADRSAAFAGILHWRGGYYRPHYAPHPVDAVRLVRDAGGVPVIAHPAASSRDITIELILPDLTDAGLFGLEVDHRENSAQARQRLRELSARYGLVTTASSDYHGTGKPNRLGENRTSRATVDAIRASAL